MIVLSLDLSLNGAGMAVLSLCGDKVEVLETCLVDNKKTKGLSVGAKLYKIHQNIVRLLKKYNPDMVVREKGFSRFADTTQKLFRVVGVADLALFDHGTTKDMAELSPTTVKKHLTGAGKADKMLVQAALRGYLIPEQRFIQFESDDTSDAVAVGIAQLLKDGVELRRD